MIGFLGCLAMNAMNNRTYNTFQSESDAIGATMIPVNTSVVSGVAISNIEGHPKILLLKRTQERFWCHVAGKIEGQETAWQAIVREFYEETQITVSRLYNAEYLEQFYEAHLCTGQNALGFEI